jgi:AraC-like DNA-binding protein
MKDVEQNFTNRQYMVRPDFEIFHYKNQPSLEVDVHHHDFYEIYFFISGKVNYIIEGRRYALQHDDILLISNQELHRPDIGSGAVYERMVLWVEPEYLRRLSTGQTNLLLCFDQNPKKRQNLLRPDAKTLGAIKGLFIRLNQYMASGSYGGDLLSQACLTELMVLINQACLEVYPDGMDENVSSNPKISEIIRYINQHLDSDLSLDSLSDRFFISKYHLSRQFRKYAGFTLYSFIQHKRLIRAKALLSEDRSLSEICRLCGFNDYSNFIRLFKKVYHASPKRYARQQAGSL